MTEKKEKTEKPLEVSLKQEDRDLLKSVIEAQKKPPEPTPSGDKDEHEHFHTDLAYLENSDSCPDCKKGLDQFGKDYMKKELEKRKNSPYVCEECGLGVEKEEEECPSCGSKDAKER